jgi:hypothetical protein
VIPGWPPLRRNQLDLQPPAPPSDRSRSARRDQSRQITPPAAAPQTARSPREQGRKPAAVKTAVRRVARVKRTAGVGRPKETGAAKPKPGRTRSRPERIANEPGRIANKPARITRETRARLGAGVRMRTPEEARPVVQARDDCLTALLAALLVMNGRPLDLLRRRTRSSDHEHLVPRHARRLRGREPAIRSGFAGRVQSSHPDHCSAFSVRFRR